MKKITMMLCFVTVMLAGSVSAQKYEYKTYPNDPFGVREYTLKNGLKVFMSVYKDAPRIQTYIAVRAGSKNDPKETTGLAHYLEHMMFKGTKSIARQKTTKNVPKSTTRLTPSATLHRPSPLPTSTIKA